MRWIGLAIVLASIPILIGFLKSGGVKRRDYTVLAAGMLIFFLGALQPSASPIAWPYWQGISKGISLSLLDSIAIALLVTRQSKVRSPPFTLLFALFFIPIALSWALAPVKMASFFVVFQIGQMFIFYIALAGELQRRAAIMNLMKGLALGLIIQAGYVISQKASGVVQATGTSAHQNIIGIMVILSLLPLLATVIEGGKNKLVYLGILAGTIIVSGGGSRGALGFLALAIILFLIFTFARRGTALKKKAIGIVLLAGLVAIPLSMMTLRDRFGDDSVLTEEAQRAAFERAARAMAVDQPLGVGANNFVNVNNTQGYAERAGLDWSPFLRSKPVHNSYLLARAETGWAGEIALILLIWGTAVAGIRTGFRRRRDPLIGLALGPAAAIVAIGFHATYEYAIYLPEVQRLFFVNAALIGACMAFAERSQANSQVRIGSRGGKRAINKVQYDVSIKDRHSM